MKTGMLATPEMVRAVAAKLRHHELTAVVVGRGRDSGRTQRGPLYWKERNLSPLSFNACLPTPTILSFLCRPVFSCGVKRVQWRQCHLISSHLI